MDGYYGDTTKYEFLEASGCIEGRFSEYVLDIVGPYTGNLPYETNKVSLLLRIADRFNV
ncbi:MAG: hypothetical protein AB8U25_01850 [Rickettsiales endosymbiont of Dermacentor nuttalli]